MYASRYGYTSLHTTYMDGIESRISFLVYTIYCILYRYRYIISSISSISSHQHHHNNLISHRNPIPSLPSNKQRKYSHSSIPSLLPQIHKPIPKKQPKTPQTFTHPTHPAIPMIYIYSANPSHAIRADEQTINKRAKNKNERKRKNKPNHKSTSRPVQAKKQK